jgi:hypothetical protein
MGLAAALDRATTPLYAVPRSLNATIAPIRQGSSSADKAVRARTGL